MSSGENFFKAPKPSRGDSFAFDNVVSGENTQLVHPFPESLAPGQKVGQPTPADDTTISYEGTPFGDDNPNTHYQPADLADATGVLPGENQDPRFC